jgi:transcriptional regulator with XRE-family HTH domain
MAIGERIKRELDKKGVSVPEMAGAIKMSTPPLYNIINGRTKRPRIETVKRIADYLGVTTEYLLYGEATTPPPKNSFAEELDRIATEIVNEKLDTLSGAELRSAVSRTMNGVFRIDKPISLRGWVRIISAITAARFNRDAEEVYVYLLRVVERSGDSNRGSGKNTL